MRYTCDAVERVIRISERKIAWSRCVAASGISELGSEQMSIELKYNFQLITSIYHCISETFQNAKQLYCRFICLYMCGVVMWFPAEIIYLITKEDKKNFIGPAIITSVSNMVGLFICETVTLQLKHLEGLIVSICYKRSLKNLKNKTRVLIIDATHREKTFDCELFVFNLKFFPVIYDIISILGFSLFELVK